MTVGELISKLQHLEQDREILVAHEGYGYSLTDSIDLEKVFEGNIASDAKEAVQCYLLETWT